MTRLKARWFDNLRPFCRQIATANHQRQQPNNHIYWQSLQSLDYGTVIDQIFQPMNNQPIKQPLKTTEIGQPTQCVTDKKNQVVCTLVMRHFGAVMNQIRHFRLDGKHTAQWSAMSTNFKYQRKEHARYRDRISSHVSATTSVTNRSQEIVKFLTSSRLAHVKMLEDERTTGRRQMRGD